MSASSPVRQEPGETMVFDGILALALWLMLLPIYTFLHESGHALLGLLFGGQLTSFSIRFWDVTAHVGIDGHFSAAQGSMVAAAGAGLPLFVLVILLARVPTATSASLGFVRIVASLTVLSSLLPWLVIPFLYLAGQAPGDDVTNFLRLSRLPPLSVAAGALTLYVGGWAYFFSRVGGMRTAWRNWRCSLSELRSAASLRDVKVMAGMCMAVVVVAVAANTYLQRAGHPSSPPGYNEVAAFSLADNNFPGREVYSFTVERTAQVGMYFTMQNIKAGPAEIALSGPSVHKTLFSAGADAGIGRATVDPGEMVFEPGEYQIELTFPRQPDGKVVVFTTPPN